MIQEPTQIPTQPNLNSTSANTWLTQFMSWLSQNAGTSQGSAAPTNTPAAQTSNLFYQQNAANLFNGTNFAPTSNNPNTFGPNTFHGKERRFMEMLFFFFRFFPFLQWMLPQAGQVPPTPGTEATPAPSTAPTPPTDASDKAWLKPNKNGVFVIKGTKGKGNDEIILKQDPASGNVYASVNGEIVGWIKKEDLAKNKIHVLGGKGNDTITVDVPGLGKNKIIAYGEGGADIFSSTDPDVIFKGGKGKDTAL